MKRVVHIITTILLFLSGALLHAQIPIRIDGSDAAGEENKCTLVIKTRNIGNVSGTPCVTVRPEPLDGMNHTGTLPGKGEYLMYLRVDNGLPAKDGLKLSSVSFPFTLDGGEEEVCMHIVFRSLPPVRYQYVSGYQDSHQGTIVIEKHYPRSLKAEKKETENWIESRSGWNIVMRSE